MAVFGHLWWFSVWIRPHDFAFRFNIDWHSCFAGRHFHDPPIRQWLVKSVAIDPCLHHLGCPFIIRWMIGHAKRAVIISSREQIGPTIDDRENLFIIGGELQAFHLRFRTLIRQLMRSPCIQVGVGDSHITTKVTRRRPSDCDFKNPRHPPLGLTALFKEAASRRDVVE